MTELLLEAAVPGVRKHTKNEEPGDLPSELPFVLHKHPSGFEVSEPYSGVKVGMAIKASYGKEYKLKWHPDILQQFPSLATAHEHKFGEASYSRDYHGRPTASSKEDIQSDFSRRWDHAISSNFADRIQRKRSGPIEDKKGNKIPYDVHYHEPGDEDPIFTVHKEANHDAHAISLGHKFFAKHQIDPTVASNLLKQHKDDKYTAALEILKKKGQSYSFRGDTTQGKVKTYKHSFTPEEASTRYEAHLAKRYKPDPDDEDDKGVVIKRHSPTHFSVHKPPQYSYDAGEEHHIFTDQPGIVRHVEVDLNRSKPNTDNIE